MLFDDYSTENCEDDQDMFPSNDIFNDDILWSLHYFPSSENLIPFQDIFPSYLDDPFENSNNNDNASPRVDITEEVRNEKMKGINSEESSMETQQQLVPRKLIRSVSSSSLKKKKKKDRHSKIDTAQGLRDRRMRLSREVARQFFDVQDMLGVDKASKAIEWLLLQSSSAIKALSNSASTSSTAGMMITRGSYSTSTTNQSSEKKKKKTTQEQKLQRDDAFAVRESREKARARAKQRTREKIDAQTLKPPDHGQTSYETTARLIK